MGSPSGVGSSAFAPIGGSDEALAKIKDVLLALSGFRKKNCSTSGRSGTAIS